MSEPKYSHPLTSLTDFAVYQGAGAYAAQGVRLKMNASATKGVLTVSCRPVSTTMKVDGKVLKPGDYAAGGVMWKQPLAPGCRATMDLQMLASVGTRAVSLLWPYRKGWPEGGELDFVENGADIPDRQSTALTNHWANSDGRHAQKVIKFGPHDFTEWSHVEVLWRKGLFEVTVNGRTAGRYTEHVPSNQMQLAFQTAVAGGGQSNMFKGKRRTPGNLKIKNLAVYDA